MRISCLLSALVAGSWLVVVGAAPVSAADAPAASAAGKTPEKPAVAPAVPETVLAPAPEAPPPPAGAPATGSMALPELPAGLFDQPAARMSLEECLATAYEKHPDVLAIRARVDRAQAQADATRGNLYPLLTAESSLLVWDSVQTASFGGGAAVEITAPPAAESAFDGWVLQTMGGLSSLLDSFGGGDIVVRDQVTWSLALKLQQPLTPLYQVLKGWDAQKTLVEQARVHGDTVKADIGMNVATAYYAALQAEEYVRIAGSAVDQLRAHLAQAKVFYEQGVIGKNDVLKVEVEIANAEQRRVQALAGQAVSRANLAAQMGLLATSPIAPVAIDSGAPLPTEEITLEGAVDTALLARTELAELAIGREAAQLGVDVAFWDLVPKVVLIAQYQHTEGMGSFSAPDTFYAGLALSWDFWDWGKTYYTAKAAEGQLAEIDFTKQRIEQMLRLQVTQKFQMLRAAEQAHILAKVGVVQAEEALRIERERFTSAVATSTDVLDAEANLTRAEANVVNAYYSYLLARAELRRAMAKPLG